MFGSDLGTNIFPESKYLVWMNGDFKSDDDFDDDDDNNDKDNDDIHKD